jgi:hypothetical protein
MKQVPIVNEEFTTTGVDSNKPVPQQFSLVYNTIKETEVKEGNFYMTETRWLQTKCVVMESFNDDGMKEYKSFTDVEKNLFVKDIIESIKGEPIDQIILILERVTPEGTRYEINEPLKTI